MCVDIGQPSVVIEEIYHYIEGWDNVPELYNVKAEIAEGKNKDIKEIIDMIQNIGQSVDQKIFAIMEKKYKVSQNIIDIIKESSLDCIQHTRDDPSINEKCIRFSNLLSMKSPISLVYLPKNYLKLMLNN